MPKRDHVFAVEEYYHCYNRGTDKRVIFADAQDYSYFISSLEAYNSTEALGKLRLHHNKADVIQMVDIVSFCLLPNHYHLLLREKVEHGISNFMKRVGIGYTMYFNQKHKRSGSLFQGHFKSKHIETDQSLQQVLSYVVNNNVVHGITDQTKYRSYLNSDLDIVRDRISNMENMARMREIVEIIKEQRLSFAEN